MNLDPTGLPRYAVPPQRLGKTSICTSELRFATLALIGFLTVAW